MNKSNKTIAPGVAALGLMLAGKAHAAAGSLDPTFSTGGVVVTNFTGVDFVIPRTIPYKAMARYWCWPKQDRRDQGVAL